MQDQGGGPEEPFDLDDLLLSEDRLEPMEKERSAATERLFDQVDLETYIVPARAV
jgi:hypothetical protein